MATRASRIALAGSNISSTGEVDADLLDNTDSSAFLSLDGNGRLGIGTANASHDLHMYKDGVNADNILKIENDQAGYGAVVIADANSNYANYQSITPTASWIVGQRGLGAGKFEIIDSTSSTLRRLVIDNAGNVGIGTTNPNSKLTVSAGSGGTILELNRSNTNSTGTVGAVSFTASDGHVVSAINVLGDGDNEGGDLQFRTTSSASGTNYYNDTDVRMTIKGGGNVGIGVTNPISKLDISSTGSSTNPTVSITTTSSYAFNHVINAFAPNLVAGEGNIIVVGRAGSPKNSGYIGYKYSGTPGSDDNIVSLGHWGSDWLFNVKGNGNVGIGTESPAYKLDVNGDINTNGYNVKLGGSNGLQIIGANGTGGWASEPGISTTNASEFRFHAGLGDMDVFVDGYVRADKGVKGAFIQFDGYTEFTLVSNGSSNTWSPSGLPGNVYVSASVFLSSMDVDQSDHYNVHFGPNAFTQQSWGDTHPSGANLPVTHAAYSNMGDSQGVYAGYYGTWGHAIFKTSSNGSIISAIQGTNAGSGVAIRIQGYWMESSS
jgi:hypothetical protein